MVRTFALAILFALAAIPAASQTENQNAQAERLQAWLTAVSAHQPGQADRAAQTVAAWSSEQIERELLPALVAYLDRARRGNSVDADDCKPCKVSREERSRLISATKPLLTTSSRRLIDAYPGPDDVDRLILRGVLLHSDAAISIALAPSSPSDVRRIEGPEIIKPPPTARRILGLPARVAHTGDGYYENLTGSTPHWYFNRAVLHFLTKDAARDERARQWYHTASAHFANSHSFSELDDHLELADRIFPTDANTAFTFGWRAETHATSVVQHGVRTAVRALQERALAQTRKNLTPCAVVYCDPVGRPFGIKDEQQSLRDAERHYADAVTRNPDFTEAHVRLARVRALLGKHADAESILRRQPVSGDTTVTFYGQLFLGAVQETLGKLDDAAAAYARALALFPRSQSANLAMAGLAQRRGDDTGALAYAQKALEPPKPESSRFDDPYVSYGLGLGRRTTENWASWRASLAVLQP